MPLDSMTANHIGSQAGGFEPQRQTMGQFVVVGLDNIQTGVNEGSGGKDDVLTLSVRQFPLPKFSTPSVEVGYLHGKRKFAGKPNFDDLTVNFQDYVDVGNAAILLKWSQLVYNPNNERMGLAAQYKKTALLRLFGPNGQFDREWELVGVWPSTFDCGDIDYDSEDLVRIVVTFTYDKAIPRIGLDPSGNR